MGPCPHMHPRRGCINGLGRAPSPYGHPKGVPIIGRDLFYFLFGRSSTRLRLVTGSNGAPIGCPICAPRRGAHLRHDNGAPYGCPICAPLRGAHLRHDNGAPYGCPICAPLRGAHCSFIWSLVHSPSARSRLQWAPIGCPYVHPSGAHYKRVRVKRCHPSGDNPFGVNFGQNYRDIGQNLRLIFFSLDFTGHTSWASMGTLRAPIWVPLWGTQVKIMDLNQYLDRMNTKTIII